MRAQAQTGAAMPLERMARLAEIVRRLPPARVEAWLRCGRRMRDGMPAAEAEALMWRELAAAGEA